MRALLAATVLAAAAVTSGCASTTIIRSRPEGAMVKINGVAVGTTPYTLSDTATVLETKTIVLEKPGYRQQLLTVTRDRWDGGRIAIFVIAGLCLLAPLLGLLWAADYPPEYNVELQPGHAVELIPDDGTLACGPPRS